MSDTEDANLKAYIAAAAEALALPVEPAWEASIAANLNTTLRMAQLVADFQLPDEAEPAPIFEA